MIGKENNTRKYFWAIIFCALVFNFSALQVLKTKLSIPTDAEGAYIPAAVSLLEGKGYLVDGHFHTHHPPLLPLTIAGIFSLSRPWDGTNVIYPLWILLLQSFSSGFLYLIARHLFGKRVGILTALLMTTYPFFIVLTATRYAWNPAPLLMFLFYGSLAAYLHAAEKGSRIFFFVSGIFLGLASLTWAGMVHFWLVLCVFLPFFNKRRAKFAAVIFVLGFLMLPLMWSGVVYKNIQKLGISTAAAPSMIDGLIRHPNSKVRRFETSRRAYELRLSGYLETEKQIFNFYAEELRARPAETLKFLTYKAFRCWYGMDAEKHEDKVILVQLSYLLPAVCGIILGFGKNKLGVLLLLFGIGYFWGISLLVLSILRYMVPAMGLVMVLVAAGLEEIFLTFGRKSRPSL